MISASERALHSAGLGRANDQPQEGKRARDYVRRLLSKAIEVRILQTPSRPGTLLNQDPHQRQLANVVLVMPWGEINLAEELVRAGFSKNVTSFGGTVIFDQAMARAQTQAMTAGRGLWGGRATGEPGYSPRGTFDAYPIQARYAPDAVQAVDADTLALGSAGDVRLLGIDAPEVSAKEHKSFRRGVQRNADLRELSDFVRTKGQTRRSRSIFVRYDGMKLRRPTGGIRKPTPYTPGQFEGMKPHEEYGFPGGRTQMHDVMRMVLDVETQGLWSRSFWMDSSGNIQKAGRKPGERIRVSEVAYGRAGRKLRHRVGVGDAGIHTWISDTLTDEVLVAHGIGIQDVDAIKKGTSSKLQALAEAISPNRNWEGGPEGPGRWDPAVRVKNSTPNKILRRLVSEKLIGKAGGPAALSTFKSVASQMLSEWERAAAAGKKVQLAAWNVGYDLQVLFSEMRAEGLGDRLQAVLDRGSISAEDLREPLQRLRMRSMIEQPNYRPLMTDRAKLNAFVGQHRRAVESIDEAVKYGVLTEHGSLRELVDDVVGGRSAWKSRLTNWQQAVGNPIWSQSVIDRLLPHLETVKDHESLTGVLRTLHQQHLTHPERTGIPSDLDVLNEAYRVEAGPGKLPRVAKPAHIKVFGDDTLLDWSRTRSGSVMSGVGSPTNFTAGGRVEDVVEILAGKGDQLGISQRRAVIYRKFLESRQTEDVMLGMAHGAFDDTRIALMANRDLLRIEKNAEYASKFNEMDRARNAEIALRRARDHADDLLSSPAGSVVNSSAATVAEMATGTTMAQKAGTTNKPSGMSGKSVLLKAAVGGVLLWGAYRNLTSDEDDDEELNNRIEGMRKPVSMWDQMEGIRLSEMGGANVSAFGSGYDASKNPTMPDAGTGFDSASRASIEGLTMSNLSAGRELRDLTRGSQPASDMQGMKVDLSGPVQALSKPIAPVSLPPIPYSPPGQKLSAPIFGNPEIGNPEITNPPRNQPFREAPALSKTERSVDLPAGFGGLVQHMSTPEYTRRSNVRDQAMQLNRLPGLPRTYQGRRRAGVAYQEREWADSQRTA